MGTRFSAARDRHSYQLIQDAAHSKVDHTALETTCIVQFTSAIYFAQECEGEACVDVMRLGDQKAKISVCFHTEDMSGKAGQRYHGCSGRIVLDPGEHQKSIKVSLLVSKCWSPALEFKIVLSEPRDCVLAVYLHTCRIKVIDDQPFPSDKFPEVTEGIDAMHTLSHFSLFMEFFKMILSSIPQSRWRTLVHMVVDQIRNAYTYYKLWAISYLLNDVFGHKGHEPEHLDDKTIDERVNEALLLGVGYIAPMLILHGCDLMLVGIDLAGQIRLCLQRFVITGYMNYDASSRQKVGRAELELTIRNESWELAGAYVLVMSLFRLLVKMGLMLFFIHMENPRAIHHVLAFPVLIGFFTWIRSDSLSRPYEKPLMLTAEMMEYIVDTIKNYRLIANYLMRPQACDEVDRRASILQSAHARANTIKLNNDHFAKWLGPTFVGLYIITHTRLVLLGVLGHGTFVATLNVFLEMSVDFSECHELIVELASTAVPLKNVVNLLNMPNELLTWKRVNRKRRARTTAARQVILDTVHKDHPFPTDLIPFQFNNMCFAFSTHDILYNVSLTVPQGSIVAILGDHGRGRNTFLRLIAHELFPTSGQIFIPTHLCILHVSHEIYTLRDDALLNLTFGRDDVEISRVEHVLKCLSAHQLLEEVQLVKALRAKAGRRNSETDVMDTVSRATSCCSSCWPEKPLSRDTESKWLDRISYSEKSKIHLARAFIMNPEVMVLQRPLSHFNYVEQTQIMDLLQEHVKNRGIGLPSETMSTRRPRTVFISLSHHRHAEKADIIWKMSAPGASSSVEVLKTIHAESSPAEPTDDSVPLTHRRATVESMMPF